MKPRVTILDLTFEEYISADRIQEKVHELAVAVNEKLIQAKSPVFMGVLVGCFRFMSDLITQMQTPVTVDFVKVASYQGTSSTGAVKEILGLSHSIEGRDVFIVEDIVDTGHTMDFMRREMLRQGARKVHIISLFYKPEAFGYDYPLDHVGFEIPNDFIVGYGLDYEEQGRELNSIYQLVTGG
jgi:hypoxanthine phosphoribosyltransferase